VRLVALADPGDPRLGDFRDLTDVAARSAREPAEGLFIAEGATVIARALAAGHVPRAVLTEERWLPGLAGPLAGHDVDVLVADPGLLRTVTGYRVHRGALGSMARRPLPAPTALLARARRVLVLVDLVDHANVGAAFRNAAALGVDAVLVTPRCADPLYRRAVKVSMGAVLGMPWTRSSDDVLGDLAGMTTIALTPDRAAAPLEDVVLGPGPRALLLGTEGDGLDSGIQVRCDVRARIPMAGGVDSLNVAAASAIALHWLRAAER
jgi:tRNA G18 (ribose-2'-O)-methylase SpoU